MFHFCLKWRKHVYFRRQHKDKDYFPTFQIYFFIEKYIRQTPIAHIVVAVPNHGLAYCRYKSKKILDNRSDDYDQWSHDFKYSNLVKILNPKIESYFNFEDKSGKENSILVNRILGNRL